MFKSESIVALAKSLVLAQKNMGVALKENKNPFFKSSYADLNSVIDAAIPALNDQDIAVLQTPDLITLNNGEQVQVIQTILIHSSGEFIAGNTQVVTAKDRDPQSLGSAITYARRYSLQSMITLKADDDDAESAMARTPGSGTKLVVPKVTNVERIDQVLQGTPSTLAVEKSNTTTTPPVEVKKSSFKKSPQSGFGN